MESQRVGRPGKENSPILVEFPGFHDFCKPWKWCGRESVSEG